MGIFIPPPPSTYYDVIATLNLGLLRTLWADPPTPPHCVPTLWMAPQIGIGEWVRAIL